MTYRFNSDYTEGCHPAVLEKLVQTNMEQTDGYGLDPYCDEARKKPSPARTLTYIFSLAAPKPT